MKRRTVVVLRRPRGRPPRVIACRPKSCPDGHAGRLILWGRRHWTSAPFRRQRVRCLPSDGSRPHTFSIDRRQNAPDQPGGETCPTCDVTPTATEGPLSPVDFIHTANEIGQLLGLIGRGTSLRRTSRTVRLAAGRCIEDASGMRHASQECGLAARYVDLFGATIERELGPSRWPAILVLDAKPFGLRAYGAAEHSEVWNPADRAGTALIAAGGDNPDRPLAAWRIGLAGDETAASWSDFLAELPGEPAWVVADGSEAIRTAVRKRWPKAVIYACEFHLGRALRSAASADGVWPDDPLHQVRFERAFWTVEDWNALVELVLEVDAPTLVRWVAANDALVRRQLALRRRSPGFPRSNGAAERVADWLGTRFGRQRRSSLRNAKRLSLVLGLIRAELAGQADPARLATIVKRELAALPARFAVDWTALSDPRSGPCSIAKLLLGARDRGRRDTAAYMADAKTRSVLRLLADENAARSAAGLAPLVATVRPGRRTASVDVRGLMLERDFPAKARDWDHEANTIELATVTAGSDHVAAWRCHRCGHCWRAEVVQRTKRLTRCQRCHTERADGRDSLAAVHPELVAEWDAEANRPLRAERIKATYDKAVVWRCLEDPAHPPYRMAPSTRARRTIGCPLHRKMRRRAAHEADRAA